VALGALMLVLGFVGLLTAGLLTLVSVLFFGFLLLVGGGAQIAHAIISCRGWRARLTHALLALLYLVTGLLIVVDPLSASLALTAFVAGLLIAIGVVRVIFAVQNRREGPWGWPFVAGLLAVLMGVLILVQWPLSGLWVIGLFVAVDLVVQGSTLLVIGLAARGNQGRSLRPPAEA
jgi:uncharacterized membrane protein HdeD (DUF308 family)